MMGTPILGLFAPIGIPVPTAWLANLIKWIVIFIIS